MLLISGAWVVLNLLIDIGFRKAHDVRSKPWFLRPMKVGNWKFAVYLLILSGFWTSFNQIFLTMPEYIRDYVETKDMVNTARNWFGDDFARELAAVNEDLLTLEIGRYAAEKASTVEARIAAVRDGSWQLVKDSDVTNDPPWSRNIGLVPANKWDATKYRRYLFDFKVRIPEQELERGMASLPLGAAESADDASRAYVPPLLKAQLDSLDKSAGLTSEQRALAHSGLLVPRTADVKNLAHQWAEAYRQVNPEYIINVDAGAIVVFQVLVSWLIGFFPPLSVMVLGIVVASIGIGMSAWLFTGWMIMLSITIFAFGEMIASPKSQEYVGRVAPQQKVAMYMGFYFWAVALGNIFGGRLSGELYGSLARDAGRPDIMWLIFGGLGLLTALILVVYDRLILGKDGEMKAHPEPESN
jgi:hypothetical protein